MMHTIAKRNRFLAIAAALTVAAGFLGGCREGGFGGAMTPQQEKDWGANVAGEMDKQLKYDDDGALNARILQIALPIFAQANRDRPDITFRIRIVDDKEVNAFSVPGGYIYVNKGLIDKIGPDDDAIACVIGHESAHIVRRHLIRRMADYDDKGLALTVLAVLTHSGVVDNVGGTALDLQSLHFNRNDEYEADRWGERYAYNAGYDPAGMLRTFTTIENIEKDDGGHDPAYALDHPITRNRVLRALEQLRELKANKGQYTSDQFDPDGDRVAAKLNGIDYPALVLATSNVSPGSFPADKPDDTAGSEKKQ